MVIDATSRSLARHMFRVGVGLVELHDAEARAIARAALDRPCADTIRNLLNAGRGKAWLPSVIDALAQVGVAAAEDVLGDDVDAARAEILEIIDRMPPHLIESARDAVRDVDIQSRIGTRSQFDEIEEQTRREEAEPLPDDIAAAVERAVADDGMPPHMIALFEQLADTPYDIAAVDAAAKVYAAAVKAAGGAYGHALAAVWRAWHREDGGQE